MRRIYRLVLTMLLLLVLSACSIKAKEFTVGDVQVFCPSSYESDAWTNPESKRYPLYISTYTSDSILSTDTATYTIQHDGLVGTYTGSRSLQNYQILRHGENGWEVVAKARTAGYAPQLVLCSNQKGKLVAVTRHEYGIGFGIYDEDSGEFSTVLYRKTGYAIQQYICGIDPNAGEEGTVYIIVSHSNIDENTLVFSFDIATQEVTEQVFCDTPYPFAPGYLVFDDRSNAHVVLVHDGNLYYMSASGLGTSSQLVSEPLIVAEGGVSNSKGYLDVALDGDGNLHVFYLQWPENGDPYHIRQAILANEKILSDTLAIYGGSAYATPFACFTGADGKAYLVALQPKDWVVSNYLEGAIFRMDADGDKEEAMTVSLENVPGLRLRDGVFNIANTRLGGRTDRGTWMIYLAAQSDNFVSIELKTEQ